MVNTSSDVLYSTENISKEQKKNQHQWRLVLRSFGTAAPSKFLQKVLESLKKLHQKIFNKKILLIFFKLETRSRGFIFPEAFRLTLVKGIVRIKNVELRPLIKARREKREVVSDWTKSVDQSKTEALVRDFQRVDKLLLPAQDWLRNFDVSGF